jgi:hypothetical protein
MKFDKTGYFYSEGIFSQGESRFDYLGSDLKFKKGIFRSMAKI